MSDYKVAKEVLLETAKRVKRKFPDDLPMIMMTINDEADSLCKLYNLSEHLRHLLALYACKLHP
jgi:hypothetical protein